MNIIDIANMLDHTNLKADASKADIEKLCLEAVENNFASVCILPFYVEFCKNILSGTKVKVCTVAGFPLGAFSTDTKMFSVLKSIQDGAKEIDIVVNLSALKNNDIEIVSNEINHFSKICSENEIVSKVIIETCLLTFDEKVLLTKIVDDANCDFIKTSTGFSNSGATVEDILLLKKYKTSRLKIKASAGIRTAKFALDLIEAGATRLGTSSSIAIMQELVQNKKLIL